MLRRPLSRLFRLRIALACALRMFRRAWSFSGSIAMAPGDTLQINCTVNFRR